MEVVPFVELVKKPMLHCMTSFMKHFIDHQEPDIMILLASEFLAMAKELPVVDVRTPAEFNQGHIPGAFNIPLFTNEERAVVGTLYKREGKDIAFMKGLDFVGPRMRSFVKQARKIAPNRKILVHCWRGGMRSGSMAWLFKSAGFEAHTLEGGYKAYRRYNRKILSESQVPTIVLGGYTGSGKTEILEEIKKHGQQVIDLEGLAHHKGSAFGHIGQEQQPTTEQFENNLMEAWRELDFGKVLWLEDESRHIGHVFQPEILYEKLRKSPVFFIDIPRPVRVQRLVKEYAFIDHHALEDALSHITKRLGGQNHKAAIAALNEKDYASVANITLAYYDKAYKHGLYSRDKSQIHTIDIHEDHPKNTAKILIQKLQTANLF